MFAVAQHNLQGAQTVGMASHGNDSGLFVEFSTRPMQMDFKSREAGRPIFEDVNFITIDFPGDKTKRVDRPVRMDEEAGAPPDPVRFPRQWQAFMNQLEQTVEGMPITEWPPLTKSQALELKAIKIHTVEALAALPDSACTWLGSRDLRAKANTWLESAAGHASESRLQAVVDQLEAKNAALQAQIDDIVRRQADSSSTDNGHAPTKAPKARRIATTTEN